MQIKITRVVRLSCFLLVSLLILSCSKDNEEYHPNAAKIEGHWKLNNKAMIFSAPVDSTLDYYSDGSLTHTEKYYLHPKTGKLWLRNEHTSAGWKYNEMYTVEFNSDYSEAIIQGETWKKQ